jgi:hypothetical protein
MWSRIRGVFATRPWIRTVFKYYVELSHLTGKYQQSSIPGPSNRHSVGIVPPIAMVVGQDAGWIIRPCCDIDRCKVHLNVLPLPIHHHIMQGCVQDMVAHSDKVHKKPIHQRSTNILSYVSHCKLG